MQKESRRAQLVLDYVRAFPVNDLRRSEAYFSCSLSYFYKINGTNCKYTKKSFFKSEKQAKETKLRENISEYWFQVAWQVLIFNWKGFGALKRVFT